MPRAITLSDLIDAEHAGQFLAAQIHDLTSQDLIPLETAERTVCQAVAAGDPWTLADAGQLWTLRPDSDPEQFPGQLHVVRRRVTIARTGGGAGPDWGAYILLYTTQTLPGGGRTAIIATAAPDHPDLHPDWALHQPPTRYAAQGTATRPLWDYAAATTPPQGRSKAAGDYELSLALYLLDAALSPRLIPRPTTIDLPLAGWEVHPYRTIHLPPGTAHAGHTAVCIGRLVTLTPKDA